MFEVCSESAAVVAAAEVFVVTTELGDALLTRSLNDCDDDDDGNGSGMDDDSASTAEELFFLDTVDDAAAEADDDDDNGTGSASIGTIRSRAEMMAAALHSLPPAPL